MATKNEQLVRIRKMKQKEIKVQVDEEYYMAVLTRKILKKYKKKKKE